jgi:hypothetical protein
MPDIPAGARQMSNAKTKSIAQKLAAKTKAK